MGRNLYSDPFFMPKRCVVSWSSRKDVVQCDLIEGHPDDHINWFVSGRYSVRRACSALSPRAGVRCSREHGHSGSGNDAGHEWSGKIVWQGDLERDIVEDQPKS